MVVIVVLRECADRSNCQGESEECDANDVLHCCGKSDEEEGMLLVRPQTSNHVAVGAASPPLRHTYIWTEA